MSQGNPIIPIAPQTAKEAETALLALLAFFPVADEYHYEIYPPAALDKEPDQWMVRICTVEADDESQIVASGVQQGLGLALQEAYAEYRIENL